jgi:tripartite-type tricarboxylate transporter receptor subunit TctC
VINQTGGSAIGHNAIRAARPDGYTVGMVTFELNSLPPQGLAPLTRKDFDPLMLLAALSLVLSIRGYRKIEARMAEMEKELEKTLQE